MHQRARREKLIEAGRFWATAAARNTDAQGDDDVAADAEYFNLPSDAAVAFERASAAQDARQDERFGVLEENLPVIEAWSAVHTQFRDGALRYEGVEAGLRMAGIWAGPELFRGLQLIEAGVRAALAEAREA